MIEYPYHMSVKIISRGKGHNAVAAAAYRAGELLEEYAEPLAKKENQNNEEPVFHDYSRKSGVLSAFIETPKGAPEWTKNRSELWNKVEESEKRTDSQLAREVLVSLPHVDIFNHLNDKNKSLRLQKFYERILKKYVNDNFISEGMVADIALHAPSKKNDDRHYHGHIMLTMRKISQDKNADFGGKEREWNSPAKVEQWREAWSRLVNSALIAHKAGGFIDHRSYEERGLDIGATQPLGTNNHKLEKLGVKTSVGNDNRKIKENNRAQHKYLEKLFENSPVAPECEIVEAIRREGFAHPQDIKNKLKEEGTLVQLKSVETGSVSNLYSFTPMKRRLDIIKQNADSLHALKSFHISDDIVKNAIKRRGDKMVRDALRYTTQPEGFKVIESADNGHKHTYLSACRDIYREAGYDVIAVARNNIGKESFKRSNFTKGILTYRDFLRRFGDRYTGTKSQNKKVILVDEADMLSPLQDKEIFQTAQKIGAKLIYIGSPKAKGKRLWQSLFPYYKLMTAFKKLRHKFLKSQRQNEAIKDAFMHARTLEALRIQKKARYLHQFKCNKSAMQGLLDTWFKKMKKKRDKRFILTATDKDAEIFNFSIQKERLKRKHLREHHGKAFKVNYKSEHQITLRRDMFVYWGDVIQFKRGYKNLSIEEGTRATIRTHRSDHSLIETDDGRVIKIDLEKHNGFDLGYAGRIVSGTDKNLEQGYIYHNKVNSLDDATILYENSKKPVSLFYSEKTASNVESLSSQLLGRGHNLYEGFEGAVGYYSDDDDDEDKIDIEQADTHNTSNEL